MLSVRGLLHQELPRVLPRLQSGFVFVWLLLSEGSENIQVLEVLLSHCESSSGSWSLAGAPSSGWTGSRRLWRLGHRRLSCRLKRTRRVCRLRTRFYWDLGGASLCSQSKILHGISLSWRMTRILLLPCGPIWIANSNDKRILELFEVNDKTLRNSRMYLRLHRMIEPEMRVKFPIVNHALQIILYG